MIKVAIADDHKLFREGIRFLLDQTSEMYLMFEASGGQQIIKELEQKVPDVLLLDLEMPDTDGIEVLKQIRPLYPSLGIIILTTYNDNKMMAYLLELGANSYLIKDTNPETLRRTIVSVSKEGHYFTNEMAMAKEIKLNPLKAPVLSHNLRLTQREIEVMELLCQESINKASVANHYLDHAVIEQCRKLLGSKMSSVLAGGEDLTSE